MQAGWGTSCHAQIGHKAQLQRAHIVISLHSKLCRDNLVWQAGGG